MIIKAAVILLLLWCVGWWGHYLGIRSGQNTELLSIERDMSLLGASRPNEESGNCVDSSTIDAIVEIKRSEKILIEDAGRWSFLGMLMYPLYGPFEVIDLERVRDSSN